MIPTLNYMTCTDCGLRGKVPRGPDDYRSPLGLVRGINDAPESARECPRCGGYLNWHALPRYYAESVANVSQCMELARVCLNRIELAWRSTPLWRHPIDFNFAREYMRSHA